VFSVTLRNYWRKIILYAIIFFVFNFSLIAFIFSVVEGQSGVVCSLKRIFKVSVYTNSKT